MCSFFFENKPASTFCLYYLELDVQLHDILDCVLIVRKDFIKSKSETWIKYLVLKCFQNEVVFIYIKERKLIFILISKAVEIWPFWTHNNSSILLFDTDGNFHDYFIGNFDCKNEDMLHVFASTIKGMC